MLRRFWFEFDVEASRDAATRLGVGVTALDEARARSVIQQRIFHGGALPPVRKLLCDVDISTLDPGHVRPNMGNPVASGIWFPLGYDPFP
jgi:hypothetical protein